MIDYASSASIDFRLILPEIVLLVAACAIMLTAWLRRAGTFAPWLGVLGLLGAAYCIWQQWNLQQSGFSGMVLSDNFGVYFRGVFVLGSLLALMLGHRYLSQKNLNKPEYHALLLVSTLGMMVMANTTNLMVMFIGLEVMSVPLYVMAGFNRRSLESNEAGIKYFIMGSFATAFLLMGIAFIYGAAETADLREILSSYAYTISSRGGYLLVGVALLLVGFGFKIAAVPFHTWVPDVYQGAPMPVTAFFSVGPKAAGIAVLIRIVNFGFVDMEVLSVILWVLAVLTMTVGNILALRQSNVKRMLAYSSIAHAGYMLVALAVGGEEAVSAALFYIIAYTCFNLGAFAVLTTLETRSGMRSEFQELAGLSKSNPILTAVLTLFMLALAGFPPTVGFFGKFYIFAAAVKNNYIWLAVLGILNSFVSVYYYLRVVKTSYFDDTNTESSPVNVSPALVVVLLVTALGTIGFGFFPQSLLTLSQSSLFAFQ